MKTVLFTIFCIFTVVIFLIILFCSIAVVSILRSLPFHNLGSDEKVKTGENAVAILSSNGKKTTTKSKR